MNTTSNADAGKNILWPGATPYLALVSRQYPSGLQGSLPATVCSPYGRTSRLSRVRTRANSCLARPTVLTCTTPGSTKENPCLY
jgi:hypothetical protein